MAAGGDDRLSQLPDDLLRRILHFAPLKEAASTPALSRRWREPLWLSSGAVNLETGNMHDCYDDNPRFFTRRDDFVSAATEALDAADVPVTRLTLHLKSDLHESVGDYLSRRRDRENVVPRLTELVDAVLSHRGTARTVEELCLVAKDPWDYRYHRVGVYTVTLDSLPLDTLRVLELSNCKGLLYHGEGAGALVLPRLSSLRLTCGAQHLSSLQCLIDAAPALASIRLVSVVIDATDEDDEDEDDATPPSPQEATIRRLRCPVATELVLDSCTWEEKDKSCSYNYTKAVDGMVEIDAPRLRRFRYKGILRSLSFSPQPPEFEQVDLDFSVRYYDWNNKDPDRDLEAFWRFTRSFASTKEMSLRVNYLEDIAVLTEARRVELLPSFCRLQRLEVQGVNSTKGKTPAMAILNLLRCCPVLSALRINLTAEHQDNASIEKGVPTQTPQKEIQIAALLAPRHYFKCLKNSLTRVGLQFGLEKSDCFGVKLIKFFAENAMVLEEMHIDGGDERLCEHMKPRTEKWNSKRRNSGATSFVILPLKR